MPNKFLFGIANQRNKILWMKHLEEHGTIPSSNLKIALCFYIQILIFIVVLSVIFIEVLNLKSSTQPQMSNTHIGRLLSIELYNLPQISDTTKTHLCKSNWVLRRNYHSLISFRSLNTDWFGWHFELCEKKKFIKYFSNFQEINKEKKETLKMVKAVCVVAGDAKGNIYFEQVGSWVIIFVCMTRHSKDWLQRYWIYQCVYLFNMSTFNSNVKWFELIENPPRSNDIRVTCILNF